MINGTRLITIPVGFFKEEQFRKVRAASKLTYGFLYSRLHADGVLEYVVYPRVELADDMGVTIEVVGRAMKELNEAGLICEEVVRVGKPKHIYLSPLKEQ